VPLFEDIESITTMHPTTSDGDFDRFMLPSAVSRNASYADLSAMEAQLDATEHDSGMASPSATQRNSGPKKLHMSQQNLMRAWTATQRSTRDDWLVWMRGFSIELLKESPSPSLRACSFLAQKYPPLAHSLFQAAFLACWMELTDAFQDDLIANLEFIFTKCTSTTTTTPSTSPHGPSSSSTSGVAHSIPSSIVGELLSLVEFMEHSEQTLPISIGLLSSLSERCHAFATALHYTESEFHQTAAASQLATIEVPPPDSSATAAKQAAESTIESLITINNKLGQKAAADGILKLIAQQQIQAQEQSQRRLHQQQQAERTAPFASGFFSSESTPPPKVVLKPLWFEKLHRWQDALEAYERKQEELMHDYTALTAATTGDGAVATTVESMLDAPEIPGRSEFVDTLLGKMRCLRSLGEWDQLASLAQGVWNTTEDPIVRRELCGLAASAAVNLRRWESLAPLLVYFDEEAALHTASPSHIVPSSSSVRLELLLRDLSDSSWSFR
jgi:FKBP12-rapamycin complex-associated protein